MADLNTNNLYSSPDGHRIPQVSGYQQVGTCGQNLIDYSVSQAWPHLAPRMVWVAPCQAAAAQPAPVDMARCRPAMFVSLVDS